MAEPAPDGTIGIGLTDTHAHLTYVAERLGPETIQRIHEAYTASGAMILDPGVEYDDFSRRLAAFGTLPYVRLAAGIWPDASSMKDLDARIAELEVSIRSADCVAVGECGLDYHWMNGSEAEQAVLFGAQVELAVRYGKPLIVHSREAHNDTLSMVTRAAGKIPVILHCFGYDRDEAQSYLRAGCYLSFAGNISYKKAENLSRACVETPASRLLLETDAPYMCPEPRRGRQSSPLDIGNTYAFVAKLRGTDVSGLVASVSENALRLFTPLATARK